jgi:hypothetical protein
MVFAPFGHEVDFKAENLSHLDTRTASGAGLGASLCTASLLSLAEGFAAGRLKFARTVVLCFADFEGASRTAASTFKKGGLPGTEKLCAALGLRAFSLGQASIPSKGHFRGELRFASEKGASPDTVPEATANLVLDCIGKKIESKIDENKIEGNGSGEAILQVTRIEAGRGGGIVEVKAESAEKIQLEAASQALREKAALYSSDKLQVSFAVSSSVPPSDPHLADGLLAAIRKAMKEQKIQEDTSEKAGGASFFSSAGIPSLTLALVSGSRTASIDTVEIASVEKGRLFLERCIELVCAEAK